MSRRLKRKMMRKESLNNKEYNRRADAEWEKSKKDWAETWHVRSDSGVLMNLPSAPTTIPDVRLARATTFTAEELGREHSIPSLNQQFYDRMTADSQLLPFLFARPDTSGSLVRDSYDDTLALSLAMLGTDTVCRSHPTGIPGHCAVRPWGSPYTDDCDGQELDATLQPAEPMTDEATRAHLQSLGWTVTHHPDDGAYTWRAKREGATVSYTNLTLKGLHDTLLAPAEEEP